MCSVYCCLKLDILKHSFLRTFYYCSNENRGYSLELYRSLKSNLYQMIILYFLEIFNPQAYLNIFICYTTHA